MAQRGDVVIVDFPFTDQPTIKRRPAVVVQADAYNQVIAKTTVAMVTGNLQRKGDPAHLFVDPGSPNGRSSGLRAQSLISCINLFTMDQEDILKTIGSLSDPLLQQLSQCLKVALDLT